MSSDKKEYVVPGEAIESDDEEMVEEVAEVSSYH